jgi:hypothetical protein
MAALFDTNVSGMVRILSGEPARLEAGVMPAVHAKIVREINTPEDDHAAKPPSPDGEVGPPRAGTRLSTGLTWHASSEQNNRLGAASGSLLGD